MTASKKNISHYSLCAFKTCKFCHCSEPALTRSLQLPRLKKNGGKKQFCYFAQDFCSSFSYFQALLFKLYMSMCAFISTEQYHRALHKPQSSGSCFFCPETQSKCGWCRRAVPRMRKLLCHVISKPLWLLLKPSFPQSFLCGLFIWSQNISWNMQAPIHIPKITVAKLPPSQVHWGAMHGSLGSWKDSWAKGMPWFVPFHHRSKNC